MDQPRKEEAFDPRLEKLLFAFIRRYRHSSIGSLFQGTIHNLNGAIQILSMQIELLQGVLAKEGEKAIPVVHQKAGQCLDHVQKLKSMVEVLVQKGIHDDEYEPREIDLNELLDEALSLLKHNLFFKHEIVARKLFASSLPALRGYYVDFSQGLSNLVQNAIEAMEGSAAKELTLITARNGRQIEVQIRDTGCGLPQEVRPQLFTPFFTTKGEDHPGLGLYISKRILTPYGASFRYEVQGDETAFCVQFPVR